MSNPEDNGAFAIYQTPAHIIAKMFLNPQGWPAYTFGAPPYVHKSEPHAEQEARKLARKLHAPFAIFRKVATVYPEEANQDNTKDIDLDDLAGAISLRLQESNRHMDIQSCRLIIDTALKDLGKG